MDAKDMIKEYCVMERNTFVSIRTKWYNDSLDYFLQLFEILKQDFPSLTIEAKDVKTIEYGGRFFKGTRGIDLSFSNSKKVTIPKEYKKWENFNHLCSRG